MRVSQNKVFRILANFFKRVFAYFRELKILQNLKIFYLFALYKIHLKIRYLHDRTYEKGGWYKKYSDKAYSNTIHKTVVVAFTASFTTFMLLQYVFPLLFNPAVPQEVRAGSSVKVWTTREDFNKDTTKSNITISGIQNEDNAFVTLLNDAGSGANMILAWDGVSAPNGWTIVSDDVGEPFYNKFIRGAETYGGTGGSTSHTHSVNATTTSVPNATVGVSPSGSMSVDAGYHTHSVSGGSTSSGDNTPPYRNLKIIKYNSGFPSTIPAGAIAMYNTSIPTGWTRYSDQDNRFIRGSGTVGDTGGYLSHQHNVTATVSANYAYIYYGLGSGGSGVSISGYGHTHSVLASSSYGDNLPPYNRVLLAKADTDTNIPSGMIAMFDNTPTGWTKLSGIGGVFNNKYIMGNYLYQTNLGSDTHTHNGIITTFNSSGGTVRQSNIAAGSGYDTTSHTHDISITTSTVSNLPPFIDVVIAQKEFPYATIGKIGSQNASSVGLRYDSGVGAKHKASTLQWTGTANATGQKILFKVRAGDNQTELDQNNCYGPNDVDVGCADWTDNDEFFSQINTESSPSSPLAISSSIPPKRYIEVLVRLESDGSNTPVLDEVRLGYDFLDAPNAQAAKRTNGDTIGYDQYTNESSVVEEFYASGIKAGDTLTPEIEVVAQSASYTGNGTTGTTSSALAQDGESKLLTVTRSGLSPGNYKFRVRVSDSAGRQSAWSSNEGFFRIEQENPTGSVSINGGAQFATSTNVTLSISASDSGGSGLSEMRFSNDGTTWSSWEPYASTKNWTLASGGDGNRTVYAQFRDNAGNVSGSWVQNNWRGGSGQLQYIDPKKYFSSSYINVSGTVKLMGNPVSASINSAEPVADTTTVSVDPDNNNYYSNLPELWVGKFPNNIANPYIKFDLSSIPENATINSATLNLNRFYSEYPPTNIVFKRVTSDWTESGLTYNTSPTIDGTVYSQTSSNFSDIDVKDLVQATVQAINYGWKIEQTVEGDGYFYSRENNSSLRPKLTINYTAVSPGPPYNTSNTGVLTSSIFDTGYDSSVFGVFHLRANVPDNTSLTVRIRGGNNADLSDALSWASAPSFTDGQSLSALNGKRYIQYQVTMNTTDVQVSPELFEINIPVISFISDSITLDTAPPASVSNLKAYSDSGKGTEYTSPTWQTNNTPYFEWDSGSKPADFDKYKYCFSTNASCIPDTETTQTNYIASISQEGNYTFKIESYDAAGNKSLQTSNFTYGYDTLPPSDVTGLSAPTSDATESSIIIRWNVATDTGSGVAGYVLERKRYDAVSWSGPTYASFDLGAVTSKEDAGLTQGYRYNYRIKARDNAGRLSQNYAEIDGFTVDTIAPSSPSGVVAVATASGPTAGYEISISWNPSTDNGSGLAKYKIWRRAETNDTREVNTQGQDITNTQNQIWTLVGVISGSGPLATTWDDNDVANDATNSDKTTPSPRLNDYTTYHYRIVAVDASGNHSNLITVDPIFQLPDTTNYVTKRTVDITSPSAPQNLTVTPMGVDTLGGEPLTQAMEISWSAAQDTRTLGRVPAGVGSGVKEYEVWQAKGNASGPTESFVKIATQAGTSLTKEELDEDSYYYYKILARDNSGNESSFSSEAGSLTKNSQVPTTPTGVTVMAQKGDPNTDSEVGTKITISFTGSRIKGTGNRVDGYRIYRSTTNSLSQSQWTALTPIYTFSNLNIPAETQDPVSPRTYVDTVSDDATTYYYRVQAFGWNESNQKTEVSPSLSSVAVGTLYTGWDTTPDTTPPSQPAEVKVKDIHGNDSMVRNIITWSVIPTPERNGTNDFRRYEVWRFETANGIGSATKIAEKTDIGDNYHVDGISYSLRNTDYSYYVVAVDNAGTEYKYQNGTVINSSFDNISTHEAPVSINPGTVKPTVDANSVNVSNIGVSAATINWITNQQTDSLVEYQKKGTNNVISAGKDRTTPTQNHSVNLTALEKNTTYQYRVISRNSLGNIDEVAATTWREFKTQDFSIQNIRVEKADITTTTAKVRWETSFPADSNVEYKPEGSSGKSQTKGDVSLVTEHVVTLESLSPATSYTFKVRSVTADKFIDESNFLTFSTNAFDSSQFTISPNASEVAEQNITATSAKITWTTSIATTSWVDYGTDRNNLNQSAGDNKLTTVHVIELENLTPGKTYYYRVRGTDSGGVEYISQIYDFSAILQPEITNLKATVTSPYTALVTFNTNVDTDAVITYRKEGGEERKAGQTILSKEHEIELKDLDDDSTYRYFVEVKDRSNSVKKSGENSFKTPIDKEGPKVKNVKVELLPLGENDNTASVIISWLTDKPATAKIEYDEGIVGGTYGRSTVEDSTLNSSHTVIIKDLNPSTTYHFRIISKDKRNNVDNSKDYNFVTPTKEKSIWQLIVKSLEETFSWIKNVSGWFRNRGARGK